MMDSGAQIHFRGGDSSPCGQNLMDFLSFFSAIRSRRCMLAAGRISFQYSTWLVLCIPRGMSHVVTDWQSDQGGRCARARTVVPRVAPAPFPSGGAARPIGQITLCMSHAGAILKSISGHAGDHVRVAAAQHASLSLTATMSAQHAEDCQLERSWLGIIVCLDTCVCKVSACSKTIHHDNPFPPKSNVEDMKSGSGSACKVHARCDIKRVHLGSWGRKWR